MLLGMGGPSAEGMTPVSHSNFCSKLLGAASRNHRPRSAVKYKQGYFPSPDQALPLDSPMHAVGGMVCPGPNGPCVTDNPCVQ